MTPEAIATIVLAIVGVLGLTGALITWLVRRGGDERAVAVALQDNTAATKELAGEFRTFRDQVVDKLHAIDLRVTRLEVTPPPVQVTTKIEAPANDGMPAHRDAGTPG